MRRTLALALDARLADGAATGLGRAPRAALARRVIALVDALIDGTAAADPALVALHDRHAAVDHATRRAADDAVVRGWVEDVYGVALDDAGGGARAIVDRAEAIHDARAARAEAARAARRAARRARTGTGTGTEAAPAGATPARATPAGATPDAAASPRERRLADAEAAATALRDARRRLASVLHPDREADPAERDRKTRLMQRANDAYAAGDLLALLELRLDAEAADALRGAAVPAERTRGAVRALRDRLKRLRDEIAESAAPFDADGGPAGPSPLERVDARVDAERDAMRSALGALRADLAALDRPGGLRELARRPADEPGAGTRIEAPDAAEARWLEAIAKAAGPADARPQGRRRRSAGA